MKKFLSVAFAFVILCVSLLSAMPAASAAKYSDWVLGPEGEYLTHEDKVYYPLSDVSSYDFYFDYQGANSISSNRDYLTVNLSYSDEKTEGIFRSASCVRVPTDIESPCLEVEFITEYDEYFTLLYVEESHLEEYKNLAKGIGNSYYAEDYYYDVPVFSLSAEDYNKWLEGEQIFRKSIMLYEYEMKYICAQDKNGLVSINCGRILLDKENEKIYLQRYNDSDVGSYDLCTYSDVTLYELEDDALKQELIDYFNTEYEDDLSWLMPDEDDITSGVVFCTVLFGVLPLAAFGFSVVMLFVLKDKKYIRPYTVIAIGSLFVILAFASVLLILI